MKLDDSEEDFKQASKFSKINVASNISGATVGLGMSLSIYVSFLDILKRLTNNKYVIVLPAIPFAFANLINNFRIGKESTKNLINTFPWCSLPRQFLDEEAETGLQVRNNNQMLLRDKILITSAVPLSFIASGIECFIGYQGYAILGNSCNFTKSETELARRIFLLVAILGSLGNASTFQCQINEFVRNKEYVTVWQKFRDFSAQKKASYFLLLMMPLFGNLMQMQSAADSINEFLTPWLSWTFISCSTLMGTAFYLRPLSQLTNRILIARKEATLQSCCFKIAHGESAQEDKQDKSYGIQVVKVSNALGNGILAVFGCLSQGIFGYIPIQLEDASFRR